MPPNPIVKAEQKARRHCYRNRVTKDLLGPHEGEQETYADNVIALVCKRKRQARSTTSNNQVGSEIADSAVSMETKQSNTNDLQHAVEQDEGRAEFITVRKPALGKAKDPAKNVTGGVKCLGLDEVEVESFLEDDGKEVCHRIDNDCG